MGSTWWWCYWGSGRCLPNPPQFLNNNQQMPRSMLLNSLVAMPIISDGIKRRASRAMVSRINFYLTIVNCIESLTLCLCIYLLFCIMLPLCTITTYLLFAITFNRIRHDISSRWKRHLEIANLSNTWNKKYHHLMQHGCAYLMQKQKWEDYCKFNSLSLFIIYDVQMLLIQLV